MSLWLVILLDAIIVWFFFGNNILDLVLTGNVKRRRALKEYAKHYRSLLARDRDILSPEHVQTLRELTEEVERVRRTGDRAALDACLATQANPQTLRRLPPPRPGHAVGSRLEGLIVVLAVAFGVRALFIQPFKIPTGSMQPTLFGIHYEDASDERLPARVPAKVWAYLNYSRRPMAVTVQENGYFDPDSLQPVKSLPLMPRCAFTIGGHTYLVPGDPDNVLKTLLEEAKEERHRRFFHLLRLKRFYGDRVTMTRDDKEDGYFREGDRLLHGYLELGDHLFVNRTSLCWREPRRGDVMVFITDGLSNPDGTSLGGRYYIKRLVGLPGDELCIRDHKLYLRPAGEGEFHEAGEADAPGFRRVHSQRGGYRGYCNMPTAQFLTTPDATYKVPEGHYFMLGDNSANSADSRYWGVVPRRQLVGTACFVWWPFSRRWGRVDVQEPLPFDTPPTVP